MRPIHLPHEGYPIGCGGSRGVLSYRTLCQRGPGSRLLRIRANSLPHSTDLGQERGNHQVAGGGQRQGDESGRQKYSLDRLLLPCARDTGAGSVASRSLGAQNVVGGKTALHPYCLFFCGSGYNQAKSSIRLEKLHRCPLSREQATNPCWCAS